MPAMFSSRRATPDDAEAIAQIYNEGIADRVATFEIRLRSAEDVRAWFDGVHPVVVVEGGGEIVAFAATFSYRPRECYAGIAKVSLYVARSARGHRHRRCSDDRSHRGRGESRIL